MMCVLCNGFWIHTSEPLFLGACIATLEFFPHPSGLRGNDKCDQNDSFDLLQYCELYHIKCDENQKQNHMQK